ncbi:hypothetical protein ACIQOW_08780 [Kitasatospora sp. NPDC091335]
MFSGRHLRPGDVVEVEVEGIGARRNRVAAAPDATSAALPTGVGRPAP